MLRICTSCDRHVHADALCPFCGGTGESTVSAPASWSAVRRAALAASTVAVGLSLGACTLVYGAPEPAPRPVDGGSADGAADADGSR